MHDAKKARRKEEEAEKLAQSQYLVSLFSDENFKKYFMAPLLRQESHYLSALKDAKAEEGVLRAAQGSLHIIDLIKEVPRQSQRVLQRKEKTNDD